jgi:hypothetical protein
MVFYGSNEGEGERGKMRERGKQGKRGKLGEN